MFRIENIQYLYALGLVPVLLIVFLLTQLWKKNARKRIGDAALVKQMMPDASSVKPVFRHIFFLLAFICLVTAIANPQIGSKLEEVKRQGADIIIALDVSNSMKAEDIAPNRLERAKQAISRLLDRLEGDRVGLIVFAGEAYTQLPITTDYSAAKLFLETVDTDIVPVQGTSIASALDLALRSFGKDEGKNKAIIVITDGEDHEANAVQMAQAAAGKGIFIHTIGMGSASGSPIPIYKNKVHSGFRKDKDGNTVITRLNETTLQQIAAAGNGAYVRASTSNVGLNSILDEIKKLDKKQFKSKMFTDYDDQFDKFIWAALAFLILEILLSEKKSRWVSKLNLFGEQKKV